MHGVVHEFAWYTNVGTCARGVSGPTVDLTWSKLFAFCRAHAAAAALVFGFMLCSISGRQNRELVWRLVICGVIWTQMSAWRWETRVWEVNDE